MRLFVAPSPPVSLSCRVALCAFWHTFLWVLRLEMVASVENCTVVQMKCMQRLGCGMALQNYFLNCGDLIHGETRHCSSRCKKALISLLSTEDQGGEAFMTCDCQGNRVCETQRERLDVCSKQVMAAMDSINDDSTEIPCTLAEWICNADTQCFTALDYYRIHCRKLIRGEKCTRRCNNSLSILYRQTKASKLRTCVCDGTEEYNCLQLRTNTDQMCFGLDPGGGGSHRPSTTPRIRHPSRHDHTRPTPSLVTKPLRPDFPPRNASSRPTSENEFGYEVQIPNSNSHSSSAADSLCSSFLVYWTVTILTVLSVVSSYRSIDTSDHNNAG